VLDVLPSRAALRQPLGRDCWYPQRPPRDIPSPRTPCLIVVRSYSIDCRQEIPLPYLFNVLHVQIPRLCRAILRPWPSYQAPAEASSHRALLPLVVACMMASFPALRRAFTTQMCICSVTSDTSTTSLRPGSATNLLASSDTLMLYCC